MVLWLENRDGKRPEDVLDNKGLATWIDSIISANVPEENDEYRRKFMPNIEIGLETELTEKVSTYQNHRHTFRQGLIQVSFYNSAYI